ncbi:MAG: UbiA-like polyprenyltransferase [Verrucomicrobiota bacterium]|nr:UbiA-like polyprenyltransferase [Verrucomicrobiota bacterium]
MADFNDKQEEPFLWRMLEFIKFSHTIFAMPFALAACLLGMAEVRDRSISIVAQFWVVLLAIVACMVFARSAAMGFNRVIDWGIDRENPRTARRHTLVTRSQATTLVLVSSILFIVSAFFTNTLCLVLSPIALILVFFYSVTKRFTSYSHFFLGLALALAPIGAWLAITGSLFALKPALLAAAVLFWVAGFDIIYATQDVDFDKRMSLNSLVVKLGVDHALILARVLHFIMFIFLLMFSWACDFGWIFGAALILIALTLIYEHLMASRRDLHSTNLAFFRVNGLISLFVLVAVFFEVFGKL